MIFKSLIFILSIIFSSGCIQLQIKTNRAELGIQETPVLEETNVVAQEAQVVITPEVIEPLKVSEITVTKSSLSQDLKIVKNSPEIIKIKVGYDDVLWVRICPMSLSQISLNYDGVKFKEVIIEHQKFFSARLMDDGRSVAFSSVIN